MLPAMGLTVTLLWRVAQKLLFTLYEPDHYVNPNNFISKQFGAPRVVQEPPTADFRAMPTVDFRAIDGMGKREYTEEYEYWPGGI